MKIKEIKEKCAIAVLIFLVSVAVVAMPGKFFDKLGVLAVAILVLAVADVVMKRVKK